MKHTGIKGNVNQMGLTRPTAVLCLRCTSPDRGLEGHLYPRCGVTSAPRYKALCPSTWPHWVGLPMDGVQVLVQHLGYMPYEYKMGR